MNTRKLGSIGLALFLALLPLTGGLVFAGDRPPLTPELAAKKEMVRKQREQRITHKQRKDAAVALKAERLKIYGARKAAHQVNPNPIPATN